VKIKWMYARKDWEKINGIGMVVRRVKKREKDRIKGILKKTLE
jgi:hypothetical protein